MTRRGSRLRSGRSNHSHAPVIIS